MTIRKHFAAAAMLAILVAGCARNEPVPTASAPPPAPAPVIVPPPPPPPAKLPPPASGASQTYVVSAGTASALKRFPKGTARRLTDQICLQKGETLTLVSRTSGRRVTYAGPGCNKAAANPDGTQSGATTIGALAPASERGAAKAR